MEFFSRRNTVVADELFLDHWHHTAGLPTAGCLPEIVGGCVDGHQFALALAMWNPLHPDSGVYPGVHNNSQFSIDQLDLVTGDAAAAMR